MSARIRELYESEVLPALREELGRTNRLALPRLEKIVVNMGVGTAITEKKHIEDAVASMTQITGQKAAVTRARKSIATFKLREGMAIGCKATMRGRRMYDFFDRLVTVVIPRVRDFRGLNPNGFDGRGNYSFGLTEQLVFPELDPDKFSRPQGMDIAIVLRGARNNHEGKTLLTRLGLPLKRDEEAAKAG